MPTANYKYLYCFKAIFEYKLKSIYFLYMAKKRGRKKKRGPKKKKPIIPNKYVGLKRPYHIITTNNGVQIKDIYSAVNIDMALAKLRAFQIQFNKNIQFPVKYTSNKNEKTFTECDYRLMLIKKKIDNDTYKGKIRNEYGKFIDCVTSSDEWVFIEELPYQVEETFWVYGYNPKTDRKTYQFIVDEFINYNKKDKYFFKEIVIYRNKLLIDSISGLEIIICKNHQDSVRLYNSLQEYSKNKKYKNILFAGDIHKNSYSYEKWYNKIHELTHWNRRKINKNTTRD